MPLDYQAIADRLLPQAPQLLADWLPGGKVHGKYYETADIHGGKGDSLKVDLTTGLWADFASPTTKGKDLIDLYAMIQGISNHDAAIKLGGLEEDTIIPNIVQKNALSVQETKLPEVKIIKPPLVAPKPAWGSPSKTWLYRNEQNEPLFYITRFDRPGRPKLILPWGWDGTKWISKHYPAPRPLYGLELLAKAPGNAVLLVEGEKACEAARTLMGQIYVVMTWPGGALAVDKIDWKPLVGRRVLMWPDADEPGAKAMLQIAYRIAPGTHEIKILDPIKKPHAKEDGWDAADAVAAGWSQADVITWAKERLSILSTKGSSVPEPIGIPMTPKYIPPESKPYVAQVEDVTDQIEVTTSLSAKWLNTGLATSSKGIPIYNEENVLRIFERDEFFKEFVWYDTFHKKYFTRWSDFSLNGHVRPWQHEVDFIRLTTYLQRKWGLSKISLSQVKSSVIQYAHKHPKNEPLDWIKTLKWDGIARIDCCLADAFGANPTKYVSQVSKNFFISLAARIADPGCKHDNMVVLEGKQETFKSSSLNILGGPWYASIRHQVGTPNFFNAIQGKWLLEIAEFDSFRDAQLSAIKDFLSTPVDRFRLPYSVTTEDFPRVSIFVGTTNEKLYLLDTTGNRRIHPIATHSINLKFLKDSREQLFAEAYAKYISGTPWHVMDKKLQSEEAEKRRQPDPWEEIIGEFIRLKGEWGVLSSEIFGAEALNIPKERQDMKMLKRVGKIMHFLGWETKNTRGEDFVQRKIWMPIEEDPPEVIPPEVSVSVTNPPPSDPTPAI